MNDDKPIQIPFNPPVVESTPETQTTLEIEVLCPPVGGHAELLMGMGRVGERHWVVGGLGYNVVFTSADGRWFEEDSAGDRVKGGRGLRMMRTHGSDAWVCGEWGYIARSSDGGETWTQVPTNVNNCCWSIAIDERGGVWGTADNGWIGYCTDGETWNGVQRGVSCTDSETWENEYGMPGGIAWAESSALGILLPTGNHLLIGNEGTVQMSALESEEKLSHAIVTPRDAIVAVGHFGGIYRSDDGGAHFDRIHGPTTFKRRAAKKGRPPMERQTHLHRVHAFDDGRLVATGDRGLIIVSNDDGRTWTKAQVNWDEKPDDERTYALGVIDGVMLIGTGNGALVGAR